MSDWDADVTIDEPLVRALVAEQFPELDASSARFLAEGWDNSVWMVEERLAFRFPRREVAAPLIDREVAVLARLAPELPFPIPVPTFVGEPSEHYPWRFFGSPLLPGVEPADAHLSDAGRVRLAPQVGRFLRALHAPDVLRLADPDRSLADDPLSRAGMELRVPRTRARLDELEEVGLWSPSPTVDALLEEASALRPPEPIALVHGDLHFRHVLVAGAELTGVIDWGDMCRADPAVDLLLYWCFFTRAGREAFVEVYGPIPDDRLLRARVLALFMCAILLAYGRDQGFAAIEAEAYAGLERTLVD
jgi:aminoglycoside phosphotransferase (APT) family kinase protein